MLQVSADLNTGSTADIWIRYKDINNGYRVRLTSGGNVYLHKLVDGSFTQLGSNTYTTGGSVSVKVKVYDDSGSDRFKVFVAGTEKINVTDSAIGAGGVALSGDKPRFDTLKIGPLKRDHRIEGCFQTRLAGDAIHAAPAAGGRRRSWDGVRSLTVAARIKKSVSDRIQAT